MTIYAEESLVKEIAHWQELLEWAARERDAGNQHMGPLMEGYANRRDSLQIQLMMLRRPERHGVGHEQ